MTSAQPKSPKFRINRQPGQNRCFDEPLAVKGVPLRMMLIPGGSFQMGEGDDQHEVTVPQFFMSKYPITQAQWEVVAALAPIERELKLNPSQFEGTDRPVERVSWYEAMEFCLRLSKLKGREYSLPSEAQWEYACRAGTETPFHFGETIHPELANYNARETYNDSPTGDYQDKTTPVNQFDVANAWGLCDMHGNVWEWCLDHYGSYDEAPTDGAARITEDDSARRIVRGGSWVNYPRHCRSAYRLNVTPDARDYDIGFRVMCRAPRALP